MKNSVELKQDRAAKITAQEELVNAAQNRAFTEEETRNFDALQKEIEAFDVQIERAEKFEANQARKAAANGEPVNAPAIHRSTKNEKFSFGRALRTLAEGKQLTGKEAEVNERAIAEMTEQGMNVKKGLRINIPSSMFASRSQSVTGNSGADGGALVGSDPRSVAPLAPSTSVLDNLGVTVLDNLSGDVPLPVGELFSFGFAAETAQVSKTKIGIAGPTLKPKRCAGVAGVSTQLLAQTSGSVEQMIINQINGGFGRAIISAAINGGGGVAPTGLYTAITSNIEATATVPTKAIITKLEELVNTANADGVSRGYLSDWTLANTMKNTVVDSGSGRFLYEGEMLNGYKYEKSSLVPKLGVGDVNHPLIFGDWAQLFVGYWGNVSILIDPYTLADSGQIKMVIEGFADVAVPNEKAFAINKVLIDA